MGAVISQYFGFTYLNTLKWTAKLVQPCAAIFLSCWEDCKCSVQTKGLNFTNLNDKCKMIIWLCVMFRFAQSQVAWVFLFYYVQLKVVIWTWKKDYFIQNVKGNTRGRCDFNGWIDITYPILHSSKSFKIQYYFRRSTTLLNKCYPNLSFPLNVGQIWLLNHWEKHQCSLI